MRLKQRAFRAALPNSHLLYDDEKNTKKTRVTQKKPHHLSSVAARGQILIALG